MVYVLRCLQGSNYRGVSCCWRLPWRRWRARIHWLGKVKCKAATLCYHSLRLCTQHVSASFSQSCCRPFTLAILLRKRRQPRCMTEQLHVSGGLGLFSILQGSCMIMINYPTAGWTARHNCTYLWTSSRTTPEMLKGICISCWPNIWPSCVCCSVTEVQACGADNTRQNSLVASFGQSSDWNLLGLQAYRRLCSLVQPYGCSVMTFNSNLTLVICLAKFTVLQKGTLRLI